VKTLTRAAAALALTLPLGLATAAPASAAAPGAACAQAGLATLKSLGVLQQAASKKIDYSTLTGPDAIRADLPAGSFLSLGQVVKLHHTNPELFAWCD
jgi:hypothetical protein